MCMSLFRPKVDNVKYMKKFFNSKYGYQFDLFTQSALTIYNEAVKLEELTKDA